MKTSRCLFLLISLPIGLVTALAQFDETAIDPTEYDQSEMAIAYSPLNPQYLLAAWNRPFVGSSYAFSADGGSTWIHNDQPGFGGDPSVGFNRHGDAFYCYLDPNGVPTKQVTVSRTTDFGEHWIHHPIGAPASLYPDDKPYMVIDNTGTTEGNIYVSWTVFYQELSGVQINFRRSTNRGVTFEPVIVLDERDPRRWVHFSMPAVGPLGEVYVVWASFESTLGSYRLAKSTDGGSTFQRKVDPASVHHNEQLVSLGGTNLTNVPSLAADPLTNHLYLVYTDIIDPPNASAHIQFVRSTDGGNSWGSPVVLADLGVGWQFFPWVSVDRTGRVSVAFMHCPDPQVTPPLISSYVIESYDRGLNFTAPMQISTVGSNPVNSATASDYMGAAAMVGGQANVLWTDYRNGNADPYFSRANTVLHLANQNKGTTPFGTSTNNSRKLAKTAGYLHEVFTSLEEVLYRRSADQGSTWELTSMLSGQNGRNSNPCVCKGGDGSLNVIWQQEVKPTTYRIWYRRSTNNGTTFEVPTVLLDSDNITVSQYQMDGVMPVITSGMEGSGGRLIVVFACHDGLHYRISQDNGVTWQKPQNEAINGQYDDRVRFPSLAGGQLYFSLVYDYADDSKGPYSRIYDGTSWSNETNVSDGTGTNLGSFGSVAIDVDGNPIAAWTGYPSGSSTQKVIFRQGKSDNSWGKWFSVFGSPGNLIDWHYPSITYYNRGGSGAYGITIVNHTSTNNVNLIKYEEHIDPWSVYTASTTGAWANLSLEDYSSGSPAYLWTNQNGPPYQVMIGSNQDGAPQEDHSRELVVQQSTTNASLTLELTQPRVITASGDTVRFDFKSHSLRDTSTLNSLNVWEYLGTDVLDLPSNARWLLLKKRFVGGVAPLLNRMFRLRLLDSQGNQLTVLDTSSASGTVLAPIAPFAERSIILRPWVGFNGVPLPNLKFHVGDIWFFRSEPISKLAARGEDRIPSRSSLSQNYPNPFNPMTTINYDLALDAHTHLKVYDVLGREVASVVDEDRPAGHHRVNFDGSRLASGVYFARFTAMNAQGALAYSVVTKLVLMK